MNATAPSASAAALIEVYADHQHLLGGSRAYRLERIAAARRFLTVHPDLDVWMARPLDGRLVDLR